LLIQYGGEGRSGRELIDASAKVRGLFTDEEIDTLFSRTPSFARPILNERFQSVGR
jgi:hypothetical protein